MDHAIMDVEQIIEKLASRYKRLKTYQDAGVFQTYSAEHASTMSFKTYFQTPSLYKFQWRNEFTWNEELDDGHADGDVDTDDQDIRTLEAASEGHGDSVERSKYGMVWANPHGVFCKRDSEEPRKKRNLRSALTDSLILEQVAQRPMGLIFPNLVPRVSRIDLGKNGVLKPRSSHHNYHRIDFEIPHGTFNVFIHAENFSLMRTITTTRVAMTASDVESEMRFDCFYTKVHFDAYINEVAFTDSP